jgi:hypothetical protein
MKLRIESMEILSGIFVFIAFQQEKKIESLYSIFESNVSQEHSLYAKSSLLFITNVT